MKMPRAFYGMLGAMLPACMLSGACTEVPSFSPAPDGGRVAGDAMTEDAAVSDAAALSDAADASPPLDGGTPKYGLFVTSGTQFGNFAQSEPLALADKYCDEAAKKINAGYTGTWLALLWVTPGGSPAARVHPSSGGWHQTLGGGLYGAQVLTALTDSGRTKEPILTEFGQQSTAIGVWTGGSISVAGDNCTNWSLGTGEGVLGSTLSTGTLWMDASAKGKCSSMALPIYCIQQPPP